MPTVTVDPALELHYHLEEFAEPWTTPSTVLLVHGVGESSAVWYAWAPVLARRYRVVRPDLRGHGRSSVPPAGYQWSLQGFARDLVALLDHLGVERAHVVAERMGGAVSLQLAADYPQRVRSLVLINTPAKLVGGPINYAQESQDVAREGPEAWARATMRRRLGSRAPQEQVEWWVRLFAAVPQGVMADLTSIASNLDITHLLPTIQTPTLFVTSDKSALSTVETVQEWCRLLPQGRLAVLPSDSYHLVASMPQVCLPMTLAFLDEVEG